MMDMHTQPPSQLTVDGIAINILSMDEAVSAITSPPRAMTASASASSTSTMSRSCGGAPIFRISLSPRAFRHRRRLFRSWRSPAGRESPIRRTTAPIWWCRCASGARRERLPVFLLGSNALTLHRAARRLAARFDGLDDRRLSRPRQQLRSIFRRADDEAIARIRASGAKLCFVALGAPRQEIFAARCLYELNGTGLLCIGAALDFHRQHAEPRAGPDAEDWARKGAWRMHAQSATARPRAMRNAWRSCLSSWPAHPADRQRTQKEGRMTSTLTLAQRARNATFAPRRYQICLIHPFDPRGKKVGGLETYIRDFITFHPANTDLLFIGVDSIGELSLGDVHRITFRGRAFDFMPILRYSDEQAREAARTIRSSLTGQFFVALLRHFGTIAKLVRARQCSVDLRRVEFSWLPALLRRPFIQMLHGEGAPNARMDSLLRRYAFVHQAGERFAMAASEKFLCVNPYITERLQNAYPRQKDKIDTLWTWVNTDVFVPQPFPPATTPFRVAFAGRLDEFKTRP